MYTASNTNTRSLKESANRLKNEAQDQIDEASDDLRDGVKVVKDDLQKVANNAGRRVRNFFDTASSEASHVKESMTHQIQEKPMQSALIALGAGFILGALFRR